MKALISERKKKNNNMCVICKAIAIKSISYNNYDYCILCFRQLAINLINISIGKFDNLYNLSTSDLYKLLKITCDIKFISFFDSKYNREEERWI